MDQWVLPLYHVLCCQLSWLVIASCELICVKCEEILPKQFTINMKPTKLTNAICLNHPLNFNSMTVLRRWLINDNPHDNPQLWTHCIPPVDILLQSLACNTKCNPVAEIKKFLKKYNSVGSNPRPPVEESDALPCDLSDTWWGGNNFTL